MHVRVRILSVSTLEPRVSDDNYIVFISKRINFVARFENLWRTARIILFPSTYILVLINKKLGGRKSYTWTKGKEEGGHGAFPSLPLLCLNQRCLVHREDV